VDVEIHPEPSLEERAAIEAAVASVLDRQSEPCSAWWRAGVREAIEEPDD
jgi:hypothetical protein